jgi:hypothetical protein
MGVGGGGVEVGEGVGAGSAVAALVGSVDGTAGGRDDRATHATSETRGTSASSRPQLRVDPRRGEDDRKRATSITVFMVLCLSFAKRSGIERSLYESSCRTRCHLVLLAGINEVVYRRWMERIRIHDGERTLFEQLVQVLLSIIPHERNDANQVQELMVLSFFCRVISSILFIPFRASHCPCLSLIHR